MASERLLETAGRESLTVPGQANLDLSFLKTMVLNWPVEKCSFQVRAEFYNALNHPQFANPDANFTSPTFGVISGTAGKCARWATGVEVCVLAASLDLALIILSFMRSGREFLGTAAGPDRPFADGAPGRIEVLPEKISTTKRICIQTYRELINARSSTLSLLAGSTNFTPRCNSYVTCDSTPWRIF